MATQGQETGEVVWRDITELVPHPRNYRLHPPDQVAHIVASIRHHGFYRNVVVASDDVILAGHGVVIAAEQMGLKQVPVIVLAVGSDDPQALKVMTGDNEIARLGEMDNQTLVELLQEVQDHDPAGLLGTGYDDAMLRNLVVVTQEVDVPYDPPQAPQQASTDEEETHALQVVVYFQTNQDRQAFFETLHVIGSKKTQSFGWPEE